MFTRLPPVALSAIALTILAAPSATAGGGGDGVAVGGLPAGYWVSAQSGATSPEDSASSTGDVIAVPGSAGNATQQTCGPDITYCPSSGIVAGAVPIGASATPPAMTGNSPAALAARAWQALYLPLPDIQTAPPRGSDGWVGIPEFFWLTPAQWTARTARAQAGRNWAEVRATPIHLTITPGPALPSLTCDGPGIAYQQVTSPSDPRACTYLYQASSLYQPPAGNIPDAYKVTITVSWTGTWHGSGNTAGTLPPVTRTATFPLRVAEAQSLVSGGLRCPPP